MQRPIEETRNNNSRAVSTVCMLLIVAFIAGCQNHSRPAVEIDHTEQFPPNLINESASFTNDTRKSYVSLYFDKSKIHLIQIETVSKSQLSKQLHGHSIASIIYRNGDSVLAPLRPDGTVLKPSKQTVVTENRDGKWSEATIDVTRKQWESFLETNPQDCSLESLKLFVKSEASSTE